MNINLPVSAGDWSDSLCATEPLSHAMLLVGYTETTIRVKNRYSSTCTILVCFLQFYEVAWKWSGTVDLAMQ